MYDLLNFLKIITTSEADENIKLNYKNPLTYILFPILWFIMLLLVLLISLLNRDNCKNDLDIIKKDLYNLLNIRSKK